MKIDKYTIRASASYKFQTVSVEMEISDKGDTNITEMPIKLQEKLYKGLKNSIDVIVQPEVPKEWIDTLPSTWRPQNYEPATPNQIKFAQSRKIVFNQPISKSEINLLIQKSLGKI